ncbi:MAG: hypothetical protein IT445_18870 [Phycisphaeraceae bacterium]|nr:hypothetical protein [Phycisphaeraceae bacterium]
MTWLLYVFGVYLAACYGWAIYLAVRLYTGKRLRVLLFGGRGRQGTGVELETPQETTTAAPTHRRQAA